MHARKQVDKLKVPPVDIQDKTTETTATDETEEEKKRQMFMVWCQLVQGLDKDSNEFKQVGVSVWRALVEKHRSSDKLCLQMLLTQLVSNSGEPISHYFIRAEMLKLDPENAGE